MFNSYPICQSYKLLILSTYVDQWINECDAWWEQRRKIDLSLWTSHQIITHIIFFNPHLGTGYESVLMLSSAQLALVLQPKNYFQHVLQVTNPIQRCRFKPLVLDGWMALCITGPFSHDPSSFHCSAKLTCILQSSLFHIPMCYERIR